MERLWLKHCLPGGPAEVDSCCHPAVVALLEESCARFRNDTAFTCMDKALCYRAYPAGGMKPRFIELRTSGAPMSARSCAAHARRGGEDQKQPF